MECRYAEGHYAECRVFVMLSTVLLNVVNLSVALCIGMQGAILMGVVTPTVVGTFLCFPASPTFIIRLGCLILFLRQTLQLICKKIYKTELFFPLHYYYSDGGAGFDESRHYFLLRRVT